LLGAEKEKDPVRVVLRAREGGELIKKSCLEEVGKKELFLCCGDETRTRPAEGDI